VTLPPDRGAPAPVPLSDIPAANQPTPRSPLDEAEAAFDQIASPPGDSFGDRSGDPLLEVAVAWRGLVQSVRHIGPTETLDARPLRRALRRPWVAAALTILLLGVGQAMVRHAALPEPERIPQEDAAAIAQWTAQNDAVQVERRAARQALMAAGVEEPEVDPGSDPLAERMERWATQRASRRSPERFRDVEFRPQYAPDLDELLEDAVIPAARERVARVGLTRAEVDLFERWSPYPLAPETVPGVDLSVGDRVAVGRRVAAVVGKGSTTRRVASGEPQRVWRAGPGRVAVPPKDVELWLADADGRISRRRGDESFELQADDPAALLRIEQAGAELLLADAERKGSWGQGCRAAERLVEVTPTFAVLARHGECLTRAGALIEAAPVLETAARLRPVTPSDVEVPALRRFLRARARLLLTAAEQPAPSAGPAAAEASRRRHAAAAAHGELRRLIRSRVHDPAALAAVDHGLHRLASQAREAKADLLVAQALRVSAVALLLLPLAMLLDGRRRTPGLELSGDSLDAAAPLVLRGGAVALLPGADIALVSSDGREDRSQLHERGRLGGATGDELHLRKDERLLQTVGGQVISLRRVAPPARVAARPEIDWRYLASLAAVAFLAIVGGLGAWQQAGKVQTEIHTVAERPAVRLKLPVELPPVPKPAAEGAAAAGTEGSAGPRKPKPMKTASMVRAARRSQVDNLIGDLFAPTGHELFRPGLDDDIRAAGMGPFTVDLGGAGGDGDSIRGGGDGGGGDAEGINGVGTEGWGTGGPGGVPGGIGIGEKKKNQVPTGPPPPPVLIGTYNKSFVDQVVKSHLGLIKHCYDRELNKRPDLAGKVVVKFVIAKDGSVSSATTASSTLGNPLVESCVNSRFLRFRFPAPKHGIVIVRYPFVFRSGG